MRYSMLLVVCVLVLNGCAKDLSSTTIKDSATGAKVLEGKIISRYDVTVKNADKLSDNALGIIAGGISGVVAGSNFGKGNGKSSTQVLGALIGAAAGAALQDALTTGEAVEYLVKLDAKYVKDNVKTSKRISNKGGQSQADMADSVDVSTRTDIIAVVQADEPALIVGKRVYVIYHDDRPRLAAQ